MHFKIEGGEMYIYICIYNIYILNLLNGAMMIYIYMCVMKRVKITKIYELVRAYVYIFTPYLK